jgi:hypothetical protein
MRVCRKGRERGLARTVGELVPCGCLGRGCGRGWRADSWRQCSRSLQRTLAAKLAATSGVFLLRLTWLHLPGS